MLSLLSPIDVERFFDEYVNNLSFIKIEFDFFRIELISYSMMMILNRMVRI
jgi:hypothetical protein